MKRSISLLSLALLSTQGVFADTPPPASVPTPPSVVTDIYANAASSLQAHLGSLSMINGQRLTSPLTGLESAAICSVVMRPSTQPYFTIGSVGSREGANPCSAEQAAALTANIAPGTCAIIAVAPTSGSPDLDLVAEADGQGQSTDASNSPIATAAMCAPADGNALPLILRGRVYAPENDITPEEANNIPEKMGLALAGISRINIPAANLVTITQEDLEAAQEQELAASVITPSVTEMNNAATGLAQVVANASSNRRLQNYTLAGVSSANLAICNVEMGLSGYSDMSVSARAGIPNGCSAEQAAAVTAPVAAGQCAMIVMQGALADDIDLAALLGTEDNILSSDQDRLLDNHPAVVVCNNAAEAAPLIVRADRLVSNARMAVITRANFAAGENGTGIVSQAVLDQRRAALMQEIAAEAALRMRRVVSENEVVSVLELGARINLETQPFCSATFNPASTDEASQGYTPINPAARTGAGITNACTTAQATALNAPVRAGQCALFAANPIEAGQDIDLLLRLNNQLQLNGNFNANSLVGRGHDAEYDDRPFLYICNLSRRAANIEVLGKFMGSEAIRGFITRINFPVPQ